jgi:hypothetical protein
MSAQQPQNVSYGLNQPLNLESPYPIASRRSPRVNDFAVVGTIWSNVVTNQVYILSSISNNVANWLLVEVGGGAGVFANLTVNPGPINLTGTTAITGATTVTGTTNINTAGAAITSINRGGTGALNLGNATGGVAILGTTFINGGAIELNTVGADLTNIAIAPATGATHIGNATGNTFIDAGNLTVTNGNVVLTHATTGYLFSTGCAIASGAGDPNGIVAAGIGSLYLNSTPTGTMDRLFVNTDGATTWTYFASNA